MFSWRDQSLKGVEEDWLGARNYCRKRCMDSVSVETSNENEWIKKRLVDEKVKTTKIKTFFILIDILYALHSTSQLYFSHLFLLSENNSHHIRYYKR